LVDSHCRSGCSRRVCWLLGEEGVVDLTGRVGYYTLLALTINAFEVPVPEDGKVPWRT
jgi:4-carboxymuconolactone decarboxylase